MARSTYKKKIDSAFTLIELLVVIAIVGILAALLFPTFAKAKVSAFKSSSISDLKQTFTASSLYSNDHDDRVPYAVDECDWRGLCRSSIDPTLWQTIQDNHILPFSEVLRPYGFVPTLMKVQVGSGPTDYQKFGTNYSYELVLSSAFLQPLEENSCPYFQERNSYFWNGGGTSNLEQGERWLILTFNGQVQYAPYKDVFTKADSCRVFR